MPASKVIVASQTGAFTSDPFYVAENMVVTIHCTPNLGVAEEAVVEISADEDGIYVTYEDGAIVRLDNAENAIRLYGPAFYKVAKGVTASATAVNLLR